MFNKCRWLEGAECNPCDRCEATWDSYWWVAWALMWGQIGLIIELAYQGSKQYAKAFYNGKLKNGLLV